MCVCVCASLQRRSRSLAQNFKGAALKKAYKQISLAKQDFQVYTHAEHLEHPTSQHAVFAIPHVSCKNVRGDSLHILFCKGLYGHLIGSILDQEQSARINESCLGLNHRP